MSKRNIPSLINGSAGKPETEIAGKKLYCHGCGTAVLKGETHFTFPNPRTAFGNARRFCIKCFPLILDKTQKDLAALRAQVDELRGRAR